MALEMPTMQMPQVNNAANGKKAIVELLSISVASGESPKVDFQKILNATPKEQVQEKAHNQQKENSQRNDDSSPQLERGKKTENTVNVKQSDESPVLDKSDHIFDQQEFNDEQSINFLIPMRDQEPLIKSQTAEDVERGVMQQKDIPLKTIMTLNDEAKGASKEDGPAVRIVHVSMSSSQEIEINNNVMFTKDWLALREEQRMDNEILQIKQQIIPHEIMSQEESLVEALDMEKNLHLRTGSERQNVGEENSDKEKSNNLSQELDDPQKHVERKQESIDRTILDIKRKTDHTSSMQDFWVDNDSFISDDRGFSKVSITENIQGNVPNPLMQKSSTVSHNSIIHELPVIRQVSQALHVARQRGMDNLTLELKPENLGRVEIKLEITDGQVRAIFNIDKAETYDLLRRDESLLQALLNESGLKADDGALNFNFRGEQQSFGDENSSLTTILPALSVDGEETEIVTPSVVIDHNRVLDRLI